MYTWKTQVISLLFSHVIKGVKMSGFYRCAETKLLIWKKVSIVCNSLLLSYITFPETFLSEVYYRRENRVLYDTNSLYSKIKLTMLFYTCPLGDLVNQYWFIVLEDVCAMFEVALKGCFIHKVGNALNHSSITSLCNMLQSIASHLWTPSGKLKP